MSDDDTLSRRDILRLTGASAGLGSMAGCGEFLAGADGTGGNRIGGDAPTTGQAPGAREGPPALPDVEGPITEPGDLYVDPLEQILEPHAAELGYTFEEYFLSGTAGGERYTVRLFLARPGDPVDFSGQVLVEPKHPRGFPFVWSFTRRYLMDRGHAAVELTTMPGTIEEPLRSFDAERYGDLQIAEGQDLDVLAQAGRLLKHDEGPLDGVEALYFTGHSRSAGPVWRFMDARHDRDRLAGDEPVFDGYFPETTRTASRMGAAPDVDVPTVWINSELEVEAVYAEEGIDYRKPDSDGPGGFRLYEVAGMPHHDARENALLDLDCTYPLNEYPYKPVVSTALSHLIRWVDEGTTPPRADRIAVEGGPGGEIRRDEDGNAVGGWRNTAVDVPTATHSATNEGDETCLVFGSQTPFTREALRDRYGTREDYVDRVDRRLSELVEAGFILEEYAEELRAEAADFGGFGNEPRPVVFVHGGAGSATQFASNAMRFSSNGYPDDRLATFEYDSTADFEERETQINDNLDVVIENVLAETGARQVNVIGHSRGTTVMHSYLSSPGRAASVANYVNVDGRESEMPPGGVRTLGVWGIGNEDAAIGESRNVHFEQTHVEVATSQETFAAMHEFFRGRPPRTREIVPEAPDDVTLSGRATIFPANFGVEGRLEVYEVDGETGQRRTGEPFATAELSGYGFWGPIDVDGAAYHEFAIVREDAATHHFYLVPQVRSNQFVRLQTSHPGEGVAALIESGPDHASLVITRDKEWWGDQGADNDELTIDGTNVINEATAPRDDWTIAPIVFDAGSDRESNVTEPIPAFEGFPFIRGIDLYVPAADPPDDAVEIVSRPRDGDGMERRIAVPNWASDDHSISLPLPDHTQQR